ncbi:hypothetical protein INT45_011056 [Circinella minor]|uniref:AB hydrolase-1 domain-containing protein n=1 Tax=Circinella minor TaxID=1195481 RepID=A0A8H7VV52_9FUNG|nr:hypothetical protein INT45_011056 [Circinella minor]
MTDTTIHTQRFIIPILSKDSTIDIPLHVFVSEVNLSSSTISPLVVLFHGAGGDHYHFDKVVPVLVRSGFRVLTCDLRYHGESQPTVKENNVVFDMGTLCQDIFQVLLWLKEHHYNHTKEDKEKINCDLIFGGLSMGSILAQVCADQPTTKWESLGYTLRGMIMIASTSIHMIWPRIAWMDLYRDIESLDAAVLQAARQAITESAIHEDAKKEVARAMALITDQTLFLSLRACANSLAVPLLLNDEEQEQKPQFDDYPIRLPKQLLITGQADEHTVHITTALKSLNDGEGIKDTVLRIIQNSGHMVPLDQGVEVGNAIVDMFYNNEK